MTHIFVLHSAEDAACAEQIRQGLEAKGYSVWRPSASVQMSDLLYPRTAETHILESAAVMLVWSQSAAQAEWVERQVLFVQQLRKSLITLVLDGTALPNTLVTVTTMTAQSPCSDVVAQVLQSALLPAPGSTDALVVLWEQAAHEFISKRRAAIQQAAEMLTRNEQREAVLAVLEYLAHNDLMNGVRESAQEVLAAEHARQASPPHQPRQPINPADSRHMFGVRCQNGHVTYFDKRRVCKLPKSTFHRIVQRAEAELDELDLECGTCHEPITVRIDCGGYR